MKRDSGGSSEGVVVGGLPVRRPVPGGEWVVSVVFEVDGVVRGGPVVSRFADSVLAPVPGNVVWLLVGRLQELGFGFSRSGRRV